MNIESNIVFVTYYYSPGIAAGGFRFTSIAEELSKINNVTVITAEPNSHCLDTQIDSPEIIRVKMWPRIPIITKNRSIRRIASLWLNYLIPDIYIGWVLFAVLAILKLHTHRRIDTIIATGPPFSTMLIPYLVNIITSIPYIVDYRDPWAMYDWQIPMERVKYKSMEQKIIAKASLIVNVTEEMAKAFQKKNSQGVISRVITNGYKEIYSSSRREISNRIRIIYAGNYYGGRSIIPLVSAVKKLLVNDGVKIEIVTYGTFTQNDRCFIESAKMSSAFVEEKQVKPNILLQRLLQGDIMYILSGVGYSYAIPFKLYDYMSVQKPILAIAQSNEAIYRVINQYNLGECVSGTGDSVYDGLKKIINSQYYQVDTSKFLWSHIGQEYQKAIELILNP